MQFLKKLTQTLLKPFLPEEKNPPKKKKPAAVKSAKKASANTSKTKVLKKPVKSAKPAAKKAKKTAQTARNTKKSIKVRKSVKPLKTASKTAPKRSQDKRASGRGSAKPQPAVIPGTLIGHVTHFFPQVNAAALKIAAGKLEVGNEIYFKGATTDFKIKIQSMQINRVPVTTAGKGSEIGILVKKRVREGDEVYKLS
jgi:hypothetical protein